MEEALQVGVGVREAVGEVVDLVLLRVLGRGRVRVGVRGRVRAGARAWVRVATRFRVSG